MRTEGNLKQCLDGQALFPKLGTGGVEFQGRVVKVDNGEVEAAERRCAWKHADAVTIVADIAYRLQERAICVIVREDVGEAIARPFETMKEGAADYAPLFARVSLKLADDSKNPFRWTADGRPFAKETKDAASLQAPVLQLRSLPDHCFFA